MACNESVCCPEYINKIKSELIEWKMICKAHEKTIHDLEKRYFELRNIKKDELLKDIATEDKWTLSDLVYEIDQIDDNSGIKNAIKKIYVLLESIIRKNNA